MIRFFRWSAVVGCGVAVVAFGIGLWDCVVRLNTPFPGAPTYLRVMAQAMFAPLLILLCAGILYVVCEIADRLDPPRDPD